MGLCIPPCIPRPTYPTECPYARVPEANICCLSTTATLTCDPSGSLPVSWSESRETECEDRPLGTNLNGVMRSDWDTASAEAAYDCLFGGVVPANYRVRLVTTWAYDCNTGLVMFACHLDVFQFDIWGNSQGGNSYYFARSTVDPDWYLSVPITVTCDALDSELVQTVACAEATVDLTCDTIPACQPYLCFPLCVVNTCSDDPETVNASAVFVTASDGITDYEVTATWSDVTDEYTFSFGVGASCGTLSGRIYCDGSAVKVDFDLFDGTTHTLATFTVDWTCVDGEVSWETTSPVSGITCSLNITLWTNNGGGL